MQSNTTNMLDRVASKSCSTVTACPSFAKALSAPPALLYVIPQTSNLSTQSIRPNAIINKKCHDVRKAQNFENKCAPLAPPRSFGMVNRCDIRKDIIVHNKSNDDDDDRARKHCYPETCGRMPRGSSVALTATSTVPTTVAASKSQGKHRKRTQNFSDDELLFVAATKILKSGCPLRITSFSENNIFNDDHTTHRKKMNTPLFDGNADNKSCSKNINHVALRRTGDIKSFALTPAPTLYTIFSCHERDSKRRKENP